MLSTTVIVVNYNGATRLESCVRSLLTCGEVDVELIVVENASTDGSRELLESLASSCAAVKPLFMEKNWGYAGAVNRALSHANGEYVAVLNMDLEVSARWLTPLVQFMQANPHAGAVSPLIRISKDGSINAAGQWLHVTGLGFNRTRLPSESVRTGEPFEVDGIHGAAFVLRRSLLEQIGGIDETGFLYHEDVNLSWMLRLCGLRLYCVPESVVYHDYFLTMYPAKFFLLERNRLMMLLSYLRPSTMAVMSPAVAVTEASTWAYAMLRGREFVRAKARSYGWVMSQRSIIAQRRAWLTSQRRVSDWVLLRSTRLGCDWRQLLTLAREGDGSGRIPVGGLSTKAR